LIDGRSVPKRRRTALLPGLVWFFVGLAIVVGALAERDEEIPVFLGLIPLGIGLAYLIYYFFEGRQVEARWLEHDLAQRAPRNP
jgi:cadmium resistance protein CadD (predicted permease)